jgi:queuine tRNA-ribosyltransferase
MTNPSLQKEKNSFSIAKKLGRSRLGYLDTPHGRVLTPAFIFCATKASIKSVSVDHLRSSHTQIILSNTYHLMVQPGSELIKKMGGLQQFTNWRGPMFTDSGGFQIFSLGHGGVADEIKGRSIQRTKTLIKLDEEGAYFRSYVNGKIHHLTPETSIRTQQELGADLIVVLDECTPFHVDKTYTTDSMRRSHRWATRCLDFFSRTTDGRQGLYGIVQGGIYEDLRKESVDFVNEQDFFAQAVGGSLGATKQQMYDIVSYTMERLNPLRPTHLLGIGGLNDIIHGVLCGIDTFDCVHPTRLARHGGALVHPLVLETTLNEYINLKNARFIEDHRPIDEGCHCMACQGYSRAYIHYLLRAKELLAYTLISIHNIFFMNKFMTSIRSCIANDDLPTLQNTLKYWA